MHWETLYYTFFIALAFALFVRGAPHPPPWETFLLMAERNAWTRNGSYDGWTVRDLGVYSADAVAVLQPEFCPTCVYRLDGKKKFNGKEYRRLRLEADQAGHGHKNSWLTADDNDGAYWEALRYADKKERNGQMVFYLDGSDDEKYLQMRPEYERGKSNGFQGFIACQWAQPLPQLFYWTAYGNAAPERLPPVCDFYNLRAVRPTRGQDFPTMHRLGPEGIEPLQAPGAVAPVQSVAAGPSQSAASAAPAPPAASSVSSDTGPTVAQPMPQPGLVGVPIVPQMLPPMFNAPGPVLVTTIAAAAPPSSTTEPADTASSTGEVYSSAETPTESTSETATAPIEVVAPSSSSS